MDRKIKLRILSFACSATLCMTLTALSPVRAKSISSAALPMISVTANTGETLQFSAEDFYPSREKLSGIIITSLPEPSLGQLSYAGVPVDVNSVISADSIGALSFVPKASKETLATFEYTPVYSGKGPSDEAMTVSMWLSDNPNSSPIAVDLECETYADLDLCVSLKGFDPEGDPLSFKILSMPQKGSLTLDGSTFFYSPSGKTGSDSFTYAAVDSKGALSAAALVKIALHERPESSEALAYTDMKNDPSHFAAIRLAEEGIMRGTSMGTSSFLEPDRSVSRAEFVSMITAIADLALPTAYVSTGMADDSDIPDWARPCIAAAAADNIIEGEKTNRGSMVLRAEDPVTRAEAAVMLNRLLGLPDEYLIKDAGLPAWSAQGVSNAVAHGYFEKDTDFDAPLTRSGAADVLFKAYKAINDQEKSFWDIF
ncbi:MAG: S-layer homology domain-containing protein [Clostridia bacterium]|nr:S-layer homology domain-containing protein [Clostridia bacterium]